MPEPVTSHPHITNFIERWAASGAAERANHQIFLTAAQLAKQFARTPGARVEELLETLVSLGQARAVGDIYVA